MNPHYLLEAIIIILISAASVAATPGCCVNPNGPACEDVGSENECCSSDPNSYVSSFGPSSYEDCVDHWFFGYEGDAACAFMGLSDFPNAGLCMQGCCCELVPGEEASFSTKSQAECFGVNEQWFTFEELGDCSACEAKLKTTTSSGSTTNPESSLVKNSAGSSTRATVQGSAKLDELDILPVEPACVGVDFRWCGNEQWKLALDSELPEGAVITKSPLPRCLLWRPTLDKLGEHRVALLPVSSSSGELITNIPVSVLTIVVQDCGQCPKLAPIPDRDVCIGDLVSIELNATDEEDGALRYSVINMPPGAIFTPFLGMFVWSTKELNAGQYPVDFVVSDGKCRVSKHVVFNLEECSSSNFSVTGLILGLLGGVLALFGITMPGPVMKFGKKLFDYTGIGLLIKIARQILNRKI